MLNGSTDKELEERITYQVTSFLRKRLDRMWKDKIEKKKESEPLDQSHVRMTPQRACFESKGVHTHITSLNNPQWWTGIIRDFTHEETEAGRD